MVIFILHFSQLPSHTLSFLTLHFSQLPSHTRQIQAERGVEIEEVHPNEKQQLTSFNV
jgi:hypothetical protein